MIPQFLAISQSPSSFNHPRTHTPSSWQHLKPPNHYELLEIPRDAEREDIKAACRGLCLHVHPDKNPGDPSAVADFKQVGRPCPRLLEYSIY